jgi:hypothetical protein
MDNRPLVFGRRLFQVAVSNEQLEERLNTTEPYSRRLSEPYLMNCANLTMVLLGIVTAEEYLSVCTKRGHGTPFKETKIFIEDAFRKCGKSATASMYPFRADLDKLKTLADGLLPGYATYLILYHETTSHAVLLRKDKCNQFFLIDAQVGEDRLYPEQAIGLNRILKYIKHDEYISFGFIETTQNGLIHENEVAMCTTDRVPGREPTPAVELPKPTPAPPKAEPTPPPPGPVPQIVWRREPIPYTNLPAPEPKDAANRQPLLDAIKRRDYETVKSLFTKVDTLNYTSPDGLVTPLIALVQNFKTDRQSTRFFLGDFVKLGANINYSNSRGNTVLIESLQVADGSLIDTLCKLGADPNVENKQGQSALDIAKIRKVPREIYQSLQYCAARKGGKTRRTRKLGTRRRRR